ncbi:MAG: SUF system NifU family Fe-S cluster assembly protein [Candidatus Marinimicrobia bacterium]|nr:SUF system NifU family Fe-S cluster assembly protein [Candidatus Neomarinimicrobiota bacterium]MBL7059506.1 SUF system NifU family Fe-S cluster assembly protein [Candidatus Neomarinimicrobiota bacterium]
MDDFRDLYQQVILDHNQNPRHFHSMDNATHEADGHNPLCGDQIKVYLFVEDNLIKDISFEGSGCAISKASSSLMTTTLIGKTTDEATKLFEEYQTLITTGKGDTKTLGKLAVMSGVHKFPARVKCAILSWHTLKNALNNKNETAITE